MSDIEISVRPTGRITYVTVVVLAILATLVVMNINAALRSYLALDLTVLMYAIWAIGALAVVISFIRHKVELIEVSPNGIHCKTGIFNTKNTNIPFHKVDNVRVNRSLVQRLFMVGELCIDTAGTTQMEVRMADLPNDRIEKLAAAIHEGVKKAHGKGGEE